MTKQAKQWKYENDPEGFERRVMDVIAEDRETYGDEPKTFALRFFDEHGECLGEVFVDAPTFPEAVMESHRLGINPGGMVECVQADTAIPEKDKNRLLPLRKAA